MQISAERREKLKDGLAETLQPALVTSYQRSSYGAKDLALRITLDRELSIERPSAQWERLGIAPENAQVGRLMGTVLEIKYVGAAPSWLLPLRQKIRESLSFSKFRFGALMTLGALHS